MPTNLEIAQSLPLRPITEVAADAGLEPGELEQYGDYKGKIRSRAFDRLAARPNGKLVLVTGITPTPAGEGKTTVSIGIAQALNRIGTRGIAALREPSLGPVFGMKGGGTGGGYSQMLPMEDINLHFTGDLHAITAANNLLAAMVDNHLQWGNLLNLEPRQVTWKRCLDMNDRALRDLVIGLGGRTEGVPRETGFDITAASEIMAVLALAQSREDLRARLGRIVVGSDRDGAPVTAEQLEAAGAMAVLLKDALQPNLAQTAEGTPLIVHCGPFANIAHGCNSVLATRLALKLGEVVVTEGGFGADLGAEKFCNIKCAQAGLAPDAAVLVATVRAIKYHGGVDLEALGREDEAAVEAGFVNLLRHAENLRKFGLPVVVAINHRATDSPAEQAALLRLCREHDLPAAVADVWGAGGAGAEELARLLLSTLETPGQFRPLYGESSNLAQKLDIVAREIYRADGVELLPAAKARLGYLAARGFGHLPICVAKTQYSFSDNPKLRAAPSGHVLTIRDLKLSAGAGFVVAYAGTLLTMPGLPRRPAAVDMDLLADGRISTLH
jgi:formate--tetrahydrofolate ligase